MAESVHPEVASPISPCERLDTEPAIFLDRDGTLVHPRHYPTQPDDMVMFEGLGPILSELQQAGFRLVLITNQSGIARGLLNESQLERIHERIRELLELHAVSLDGVYYCPHHVDGVIPSLSKACSCRKPSPGMLLRAIDELGLDPQRSWMIGDILDDVEAGNRAGCRTVLVDLGTEDCPDRRIRTPTYVATDPVHALNIVRSIELERWDTDRCYRPERWKYCSGQEVLLVG